MRMKQQGKNPDLLIIGNGVIGWAIAYYAAKAGLSVKVIDRNKTSGRASSIAAGLIAPSPQLTKATAFSKIALASVALFPSLQHQLLEDSGIDIELRTSGTLRIATSE